jgi:uncharacterized repeat protein (TIGR01451 family)
MNILKSLRASASIAAVGLALLFVGFAPPSAQAAGPQWTVTSVSSPTNFKPATEAETEDSYKVLLTNTGSASSNGSPVTVTDVLPAGLALDSAGASGFNPLAKENGQPPEAGFSCVLRTCTYGGVVAPDQTLQFTFPVDVTLAESGSLINTVHVSGGGAPAAQVSIPTAISSTPAQYGIAPGGATTALSTTQAGAHPDLTNTIAFNTVAANGAQPANFKDVAYDLPPGFAGDLIDTPACGAAAFLFDKCPISTQVGITTVTLTGEISGSFMKPVYNLAPNPGEVAKIGFNLGSGIGLFIEGGVTVRPGDYGLRTVFSNTNQALDEVNNVSLTIWGVPASGIHDPLRWKETEVPGSGLPTIFGHFGTTTDSARVPFFTNPTSCSGEALHSSFLVTSWEHPDPAEATTEQMPFGPIVGCDRLTIEPTIETQTSTDAAETATGLNVALSVPQTNENAGGLATSHLDDATVTLPEGMSLNPSAGSGLGSCSLAQFAYEGTTAAPIPGLGCPNNAKVGSVKVKSPAVAEEAFGSLYVARPFENRFNSLLALYLVARIPNRGVVVTAAGKVTADERTGQLTTVFEENPQLPFSDFTLAFRQGATSPLVTPPICGAFTADADLTPWSVPDQQHLLSSSFEIIRGVGGGPCPSGATPPFHPGLFAGTVNNRAGSYSPFYVRLSRQDGEQEITHFSIKLPPGVSGKLAGIPECSDAAIAQAKSREHDQGGAEEEATPSCPAASEIGHSLVEAGVGSVLAQAPGKMYLAGPYHGSNLSMVSITAAKVGPFDLGTVVVRFALKIDPETAEVSVDGQGSDPIPHIVDGIPVHLRNIRAYVDRPDFALNPTSCKATSTASTVLGSGKDFVSEADDVPVTVTSPFQAADCAALGFKPSLALSLKGGTKRGATPAFKAVLTYPKGTNANIAESQVTLPHSEFLEQSHIGTVCTRPQFKEGKIPGEKCPAASVYGRARAVTPILSEPLEGPVYLRSSSHNLPDLVAALHNSQVDIALDGRIDSVENGRIRNTFEAVPDAPVSKFVLEMQGGKKGLLVNSTDICRTKHKAISHFVGQNGKVYDTNPVLAAKCPKAKKKGKAKKGRRNG